MVFRCLFPAIDPTYFSNFWIFLLLDFHKNPVYSNIALSKPPVAIARPIQLPSSNKDISGVNVLDQYYHQKSMGSQVASSQKFDKLCFQNNTNTSKIQFPKLCFQFVNVSNLLINIENNHRSFRKIYLHMYQHIVKHRPFIVVYIYIYIYGRLAASKSEFKDTQKCHN